MKNMESELCPKCESPMVLSKIAFRQQLRDKLLYVSGVEAFVCTNSECNSRYLTEKGTALVDDAYRSFFITPQRELKLETSITQIGGKSLGIYLPKDIVTALHLKKGTTAYLSIDGNRIIVEPETP